MRNFENPQHRAILKRLAHLAMLDRGLIPDLPLEALIELEDLKAPAMDAAGTASGPGTAEDCRETPWCSIDDDDSLDLNRLTAATSLTGGLTRVLVAVTDVDALVKKDSALDEHAKANTTSVYTVAQVFPMLPDRISSDLASLNQGEDRFAVVFEMDFSGDGTLRDSRPYRAMVRNHAKLAYDGVAYWLEAGAPRTEGALPREIGAVEGLAESLALQDRLAVAMKALRIRGGALDLETLRSRPVFTGNELKDLEAEKGNRAKDIIEELMIAANGVAARYLAERGVASLRRAVRIPKRWDGIVALAAGRGEKLPPDPDSSALERFLAKARKADPLGFPDLSLSVVKLLGRGEYVAETPSAPAVGHFALAVEDYARSTAPNRRYPDLVSLRLMKAAIAGLLAPYSLRELEVIAQHCTEEEDAANKVERQVHKSAAALLLESRIGESFDAVVTGASEKATWVRIPRPMAEGRLEIGFEGAEVGEALRVELLRADVERGYIDFKRSPGSSGHERRR